jgi:hypothetical protein
MVLNPDAERDNILITADLSVLDWPALSPPHGSGGVALVTHTRCDINPLPGFRIVCDRVTLEAIAC